MNREIQKPNTIESSLKELNVQEAAYQRNMVLLQEEIACAIRATRESLKGGS